MESLGLLKVLLEIALRLPPRWREMFLRSFVTIVMFSVFWGGVNIAREGNVLRGLNAAFVNSTALQADRQRDLQTLMLQAEIRNAAITDIQINNLVRTLLSKSPGSSRIRMATIHNGTVGMQGNHLFKFDITTAIAAPGHDAGPLIQDQPIAGWVKMMPQLLGRECVHYPIDQIDGVNARARVMQMGARYVAICPIININSHLLGVLFVQWDSISEVPTGDTMKSVLNEARGTGQQLAVALDVRSGGQ